MGLGPLNAPSYFCRGPSREEEGEEKGRSGLSSQHGSGARAPSPSYQHHLLANTSPRPRLQPWNRGVFFWERTLGSSSPAVPPARPQPALPRVPECHIHRAFSSRQVTPRFIHGRGRAGSDSSRWSPWPAPAPGLGQDLQHSRLCSPGHAWAWFGEPKERSLHSNRNEGRGVIHPPEAAGHRE